MRTVMQWTLYLLARIEEQTRYAKPYEIRYRNQYVLPFIAAEYREVYGATVDSLLEPLVSPPRAGTAAIGIDALVERLTVLGATSDDPEAVRVVQAAWEDNDLDVMHREAHREALIKARSFARVSRDVSQTKAIVGIESPEQMAVHREQVPPYDVDASLKVWMDEFTGVRRGILELPGRLLNLIEGDRPVKDPEGSIAESRWLVEDEQVGLDRVPVVEFASRARLLAPPISEIEPIVSLVDIVDLVEGLMVFAGHFGAIPIRYATGVEVMRDPSDSTGATPLLGPDGQPVMGFMARPDHMWLSSNKDTQFGQMVPASLDSFVVWAEHASSRVRAKTSIASTYYSLDLKSHMSAELLKTDEAPMVRRVLSMGRDGSFGQSWRRVDQLILAIERPTLSARVKPRWADPNTRVEAQATDSFQKAVAAGLGVRVAAREFLGWDPDLVNAAVDEAEQAARAAMQLPPGAPAGGPTPATGP